MDTYESDMRAVIKLFSKIERERNKFSSELQELTKTRKGIFSFLTSFFAPKKYHSEIILSEKKELALSFSGQEQSMTIVSHKDPLYVHMHPYSFSREKNFDIEVTGLTKDIELQGASVICVEEGRGTLRINIGQDNVIFKIKENTKISLNLKKIRGIPSIVHIFCNGDISNKVEKIHDVKKKIVNSSLVYEAFIASMESSIEEGIHILKKYNNRNSKDALNLFYACKYYEDDEKWCSHVNNYLKKYNISPIKLRSGNYSKFKRLYTESAACIYAGPKVTVIMPAYNAEQTIEMAVHSILAQTWKNIELIVMDDSSSDGTWDILQKLAQQDSRVRIFRNAANVGPYVSKNIALDFSTGEFITGHDADDWAHPDRIYNQVSVLLKDQNIHVCAGYMLRMYPDGRISQFGKIGFYCSDGSARLASISCMFRKESLKKYLGYWDCVRFGADSELISRARKIFGTTGFYVAPQMTMFCLDVPTSLTNSSTFGVKKVGGLSPARQLYRNSWNAVHNNILPDVPYRLDFPVSSCKYECDETAVVNQENLRTVLKNYGQYKESIDE